MRSDNLWSTHTQRDNREKSETKRNFRVSYYLSWLLFDLILNWRFMNVLIWWNSCVFNWVFRGLRRAGCWTPLIFFHFGSFVVVRSIVNVRACVWLCQCVQERKRNIELVHAFCFDILRTQHFFTLTLAQPKSKKKSTNRWWMAQ